MPDTVVTTGVAASATETKKKTSRSPINQAQARELNRSESVAQAAKKEAFASPLESRDIDAEFADGLMADIGKGRDKAAEALAHTTAHRNATSTAKQAAKKLEAGLREVQKAAKQKYSRSNRIALGDYLIGKKLNGSRPNLAQTSQTIINRATDDKLPGFTAPKVKSLGTQRQAWLDAQATQAEAETATLSARAELKTLLDSIKDRRIAVQLAADAEWPHTDAEHAGTRKEFALSPKSPLKV